ncbi:MAG: cysW 2 [Verrucomicrobiaceae bacterium]|nr:cysW 2 [Verrucomicrobiaceae bacterium]
MPALALRDKAFRLFLGVLGGGYVLLVLLMLAADMTYASSKEFTGLFGKPEILASLRLTLVTCTISGLLSLLVAVPLGYVLSRHEFPLRWLVDALVEIPVVLPPLVVGLSLLILFHLPLGGTTLEGWLNQHLGWHVTYAWPAVILAQFAVAGAFAIRTMRVTFDQMPSRCEQVALTLGCTQCQAFLHVTLPQARRGMVAAFTIAWARSLGEFGPVQVFASAIRMRTEVLSTTVFLELSTGSLETAVSVSLIMVMVAMAVLVLLRRLGLR